MRPTAFLGPAGAGFFVGAALAAAYFALLTLPALAATDLKRYSTGNSVEVVTIALFCWGLGDLLIKALGHARQRAALRRAWLPNAAERDPDRLLTTLDSQPAAYQTTWVAERLREGVRYVHGKGSAAGLEGHLQHLGDTEADQSHGRYALVRIIAWMIPILGFLGTVVGITEAVANVAPDQLESSLNNVTGGLAMAFDATAVALALAMGLMFAYFLVERSEQGMLHEVEALAGRQLRHRFDSADHTSAPFLDAVRAASLTVVAHTQQLADVHAQSVAAALRPLREEAADRQAALLGQMNAHAAAVEAQVVGHLELARVESARQLQLLAAASREMTNVTAAMGAVADRVAAVAADEAKLLHLHQSLAESLRMLNQAQGLDEAVHSLTAAVHLLTARYRLAPPAPAEAEVPSARRAA